METTQGMTTFNSRLAQFLKGAQQKVNDYWTENRFSYAGPPLLEVEFAPKYVRIWKRDRNKEGEVIATSKSIYVFIDRTNGKYTSDFAGIQKEKPRFRAGVSVNLLSSWPSLYLVNVLRH